MNYPVWQIPEIGGSTLIAIISILHVYIAHLAVGGGLFLVLTEHKARRENNPVLLEYVKKHTRFFLLLTMVFGGLTGVGIWFIISLVHPAGTSALIHTFVFGWAIEWTFFIAEITALLIYYYFFDRMRPSTHLAVGWLYFVFAYLSLVVINGIITFMLTPGDWLQTRDFWHGFFNPTYFASLAYRTAFAFTVAGLFGLITAVFHKDDRMRAQLSRYCARWTVLPFILLAVATWWYARVIPDDAMANIMERNRLALPFARVFFWTGALVFLGGLISFIRMPAVLQRAVVFVVVIIGLGWLAGFEYLREIARKPFVIYDYMYSTSIRTDQAEELSRAGFLPASRWTTVKEITDDNRLEAGRELFVNQCLSCHSMGGYNNVLPLTSEGKEYGLRAQLTGQGKVHTYMPPFIGTSEEKEALAAYISRELHGKPAEEPFVEVMLGRLGEEVPPFDTREDDYVIFAWNDLGMHCISDCDPWFVILPPANTLMAQLVKRGPVPEVMTEGVEITYSPEPGFENPQDHVPFWKHVKSNFGADLEPGIGLFGLGMQGAMKPVPRMKAYAAPGIPVVPYPDGGGYNPYPRFRIQARLEGSDEVVAETWVVAPASTEMGCKNCHAGGWAVEDRAGVSDATARDILRLHDKRQGTTLLTDAEAGRPRLCASCHADPALGAEGDPQVLNMSAALHGFHAAYLSDMGADACASCHPAGAGGSTRCLRGRHGQGLTCLECHGSMEEHALSLLIHEREAGKPAAERLMRNLKAEQMPVEEIKGRMPWVNEPDCLTCHVDYELAEMNSFNAWTPSGDQLFRNRLDDRGMMCVACHGAPHAVYPAVNAYAENLDNIQPLQYQGVAGTIGTEGNCQVCHRQTMDVEGHHRRMARR